MNLINSIASALHEEWRKTRLNTDGTFNPRWKEIKDVDFVNNLNQNQLPPYIRKNESMFEIDIANTAYNKLSPDWQKENKEAAIVVAKLLNSNKKLTDSEIGNIIHSQWLKRNTWAVGGKLDVPFDELPKEEQDKDLVQYKIGKAVKAAKHAQFHI